MILEGPSQGPWDHRGTPLDPDLKQIPNLTKTTPFLDLFLETFFHQVFLMFHCSFKLRLWEPCKALFKGFWRHFETISGPLIEMKLALASFAIALAINVFPVPGAPKRTIPRGGLIPKCSNISG